jgi:threonine/homoserine/homoserine lactone efflux protein
LGFFGWVFWVSFLFPTLVPGQRSTALPYALTAAYCLLSLSYEALVLALLAAFLRYWTRAEERRAKTRPVLDGGEELRI